MNLDKCCHLISKAKNDNEKLAALLVVARNFKPVEVSKSDAENLLKAISPTFFEKLLRSGKKNADFLQICLILGIVESLSLGFKIKIIIIRLTSVSRGYLKTPLL